MKLSFLFFFVLLGCNSANNKLNNNSKKTTDTNKIDIQKNTTGDIGNQKTDSTNQINKTSTNNSIDYSVGAPTIIYKTKMDYNVKIPVLMNVEKTKIMSFPALTDIYYNGKFAYPVQLNDGYLLDNRGIDKNSVFLSITYEEYSKLAATPSLDEMMKMIIDKDPFTEIYNCGNRYQYKDIVAEINKYIDSKQLDKFKKIK